MTQTCRIGPYCVGEGHPLLLIAGPCVLESPEIHDQIVATVKPICDELGFNYIFKASFDKANRSSIHSARGPGEHSGLRELDRIRRSHELPVLTDVHEPQQAAVVAETVDVLQVPAFLCRQTDLLVACAKTGRPINVKKGQFMAPAEMVNVVNKLREGGCKDLLLTERGTFFGYHRLVNDFIGLGDLMALGPPVCFDATHSTQLPGGETDRSAGRPERAGLLCRAATAAGVHALFIETHPVPERALSDASTVQPLGSLRPLLETVAALRAALAPAGATSQ